MSQKILSKSIPLWTFLAVVSILGVLTVAAFATIPPVTQLIKELRPKTTTVEVADTTYSDVSLTDTDDDGKANTVTVKFDLDKVPDNGIKITVTLKDVDGVTLDATANTSYVKGDLVVGENTKTIDLTDADAVIDDVKSIVIVFEA